MSITMHTVAISAMVTRNYFAFLYRILVEMAANNVISFVKVRRFMRLE